MNKEYHRKYYLSNKDYFSAKSRENYKKKKEDYIERLNLWRKNNPEKYRLQSQRARRTLNGHITRLWCAMNRRTKVQSSYKNRKIEFDKEWFVQFCLQNQQYKKLFGQWKKMPTKEVWFQR